MRKLLLIFSVYTATFFIGVSFVIFLHFVKTKNIEELPKQTESKAELAKPPKEIVATPKIFAVKNFWDEIQNHENKYLIEPGEVDQKDIKIKSGKSWLGLFGDSHNSYLRQTKVRIDQTDKTMLDWSEITVEGKESPLFLVKGLRKVKAGKVTTLFRGKTLREETEEEIKLTKMEKGFSREFKLGERQYTLRVEEGVDEKNEKIQVLLLETDKMSQIVFYIDYVGNGDYVGDLYWVGDLDSDGKLDLFMNFWNYEKGYYSSGLFLSTEAKKGQLVKRFEFLAYGGC
jgi:hypothetical protein